MSALILASASPRRREMLERVGVPIEIVPAHVDETPRPNEAPAAYVARIADAKAMAIAARPEASGRYVLAADTTVTIDREILAKAETPAEATAMLKKLAGRSHQVITAFAIVGPSSSRAGAARAMHRASVSTDVAMTPLDDALLAAYVATNEWRDKAGAYAIQGIAAAFVRAVRGSVTNVAGLPLAEVLAALREVGAPSARLERGVPA